MLPENTLAQFEIPCGVIVYGILLPSPDDYGDFTHWAIPPTQDGVFQKRHDVSKMTKFASQVRTIHFAAPTGETCEELPF